MKLLKEDETWKDYVADGIHLIALIVVIGLVLYCVTLLVDWAR